jgi:hypothetical protein
MRKTLLLILIVSFGLNLFAQDYYFNKGRLSVYRGYRDITVSNRPNKDLDFLNYVYTDDENSLYQYTEATLKLWSKKNFQLEGSMAIYNELKPYCFKLSFNYQFKHGIGLMAGAMSNRLYLVEYNSFYATIYNEDYYPRSLDRQWHFSIGSAYIAPTYELNYKWVHLEAALKTGLSSYMPFHQRDIIKQYESNFKRVLDYETLWTPAIFAMPEVELLVDLIKYKKGAIGGRMKFSYFYTRNALKYTLTTYDWTYDNPVAKKVNNPKHAYQQSDFDIGLFVRW